VVKSQSPRSGSRLGALSTRATIWQPKGGADASDKTVKLLQRTNGANEVLRFDYRFATGRVSSPGSYEAGQLLVSQTTDEHGLKTLEYKDKEGQVVAKRVQEVKDNESSYLTTAYVYDDLALQRLVIQPKGMANLTELSTNYDSFVSQWCYAYDYDARRRQVSKRVPGAEPVWMVYNRRDELVLSQDGNGRKGTTANPANQWNFTKYDALGRVVMSGLYTHPTATSQAQMQALVNANSTLYETPDLATGSVQGYSNSAFPTTNTQPQSVSYYDNYNFEGASAKAYAAPGSAYLASASTFTKGRSTGGKTLVVGTSPAKKAASKVLRIRW